MEPSADPGLAVVTNAINIAMQLAVRPRSRPSSPAVSCRALVRARRLVYRRGARQHRPRLRVHRRERHRPRDRSDLARRTRGRGQRPDRIARRATRCSSPTRRSRRRAFAAIGSGRLFSTLITDSGVTATSWRVSPTGATTLSLRSEFFHRRPLRAARQRVRHRCPTRGCDSRVTRLTARGSRRRLARSLTPGTAVTDAAGRAARPRVHRRPLPRRRRRLGRRRRAGDRHGARRAQRARHDPLGALARDGGHRTRSPPGSKGSRGSPHASLRVLGAHPREGDLPRTDSAGARDPALLRPAERRTRSSDCRSGPPAPCAGSRSRPSTTAPPTRSDEFTDAGVRVAVGRTGADFATVLAAFDAGARHPHARVQRHARHPPLGARSRSSRR